MNHRARVVGASLTTLGIFLAVQVGALALITPFQRAGFQAVENPSDPTNSLVYLVAILVATGVFLVAIRFGVTWLIRGLIIVSSAFISLYVLSVLVPPALVVTVDGARFNALALGGALALALALLVYPEWYVIDAVGVVMGAGAAGIFGISFGLLPAVVLLSVLAVYDAISVYGTEHMLTLADGVMDMKVPVVLVVPLVLSYSYLDGEGRNGETDGEEEGENGPTPDAESEAWIKDSPENLGVATNGGERAANDTGERRTDSGNEADASDDRDGSGVESRDEKGDSDRTRDAFFIGLGDAVMPTVMVASAAFFAPVPEFGLPGIALNLPALTAIIGTLAGLVVLLWLVFNGRAHAGLPLLNGGAIGGYLLGALASGVSIVNALGLGPYL